jgi:hypothetical protein
MIGWKVTNITCIVEVFFNVFILFFTTHTSSSSIEHSIGIYLTAIHFIAVIHLTHWLVIAAKEIIVDLLVWVDSTVDLLIVHPLRLLLLLAPHVLILVVELWRLVSVIHIVCGRLAVHENIWCVSLHVISTIWLGSNLLLLFSLMAILILTSIWLVTVHIFEWGLVIVVSVSVHFFFI